MKTYCIKFERELDGVDIIHIKSDRLPDTNQAIQFIKDAGYVWSNGYDTLREIFEVK
jgi:hypothetical protein